MSKQEKSLDGPNNDPRNFATVDDQETLSQNQWTSMRGDRGPIGFGAKGAAGRIFDRDEDHDFDPEKTAGGYSQIGKGFTELEKRKLITSAVKEAAEDLAHVKDLERVLDKSKEPEDKGYLDCEWGRLFEDNVKHGKFEGKIGSKIGGGAIGSELSDGDADGSIGRKIGANNPFYSNK